MGKYALAIGVAFLAAACSNVDNMLPVDVPKANSKAIPKKLPAESKPAALKQDTSESLGSKLNELPAKDEIPSTPSDGLSPDPSDYDRDDLAPFPGGLPGGCIYPPKGLPPEAPGGGVCVDSNGLTSRAKKKSANDSRIKAALNWLKDHQSANGRWSATKFGDHSTRKDARSTYNIEFINTGDPEGDQGWEEATDVGLTGLALLAFAADGHSHTTDGDYSKSCRNAVKFLRRSQDHDGCFGPQGDDHFVYNHAICTMAMAEMYGITGLDLLKPIVGKAVGFILKAQNPGSGWRYGIQLGNSDGSVTGWMISALKSAKLAGIEVESKDSYDGAETFYKELTVKVADKLKVGYKTPGSTNARLRGAREFKTNLTIDSMYVYSMLAMEKKTTSSDDIIELSKYISAEESLPVWEKNKIDYYYWYQAALAMHQVGSKSWKAWKEPLFKVLTDNQRGYHSLDKTARLTTPEALDEHGSWDSVGAWGMAGGRVYSTAINCLTLAVDKRYEKFSKKKK